MIFVESKRKKEKTLKLKHPNAKIIDLTSKSSIFKVFSPFYPHGDIPVPFSKGTYSYSVEGIWQGLKVFKSCDIDISKFDIRNMKGLKRTIRVFGPIKGHRKGIHGTEILDYKTARRTIFLESYNYILSNRLAQEISTLQSFATNRDLVLLDYETNTNFEDISKPISHAGLVKNYLESNVDVYVAPKQLKLNL